LIHAAGAVPSSLHQKLNYVQDCCLIEISAEHEYAIKQISGLSSVGSTEAGGEEFLRGFEIVAVSPVYEGTKLSRPRLSRQIVNAARTTIAVVGKKNLKRKVDESLSVIYPKKNEGTFGLGFRPSNTDRARAKADRRERKRARLAGQAYVEQPMNIPSTLRAFQSGGFINPAVISTITQDAGLAHCCHRERSYPAAHLEDV
jgi:hypothetical protein